MSELSNDDIDAFAVTAKEHYTEPYRSIIIAQLRRGIKAIGPVSERLVVDEDSYLALDSHAAHLQASLDLCRMHLAEECEARTQAQEQLALAKGVLDLGVEVRGELIKHDSQKWEDGSFHCSEACPKCKFDTENPSRDELKKQLAQMGKKLESWKRLAKAQGMWGILEYRPVAERQINEASAALQEMGEM